MYQKKKNLWHFNIDRQYSVKPQIEKRIQDLISSGELVPGEQICSCKELARINSVNKNTVNKAYKDLKAKNVLESYYRIGTYVSELAFQDTEEHYSVPAPFSFQEPYNTPALPTDYLPCLVLGCDEPDPSVFSTSRSISLYKDVLKSFSHLRSSNRFIGEELYCSIVKFLRTRKIQVSPSQVAVVHGLRSALHMVANLLVKPGDGVVMGSPSDTYSLFAFTSVHASLHFTGVDWQGMKIEQLELLCQKARIKVVYLRPAADYPAMSMLSEPRRLHLLQLARRYHFVIIEMDEEHEFWYRKPLVPLVSRDHDGRVIHICPISRMTYRMHAIGIVTGPTDFIAAIRKSADLSGDHRDLIFEKLAIAMIADRSIFHIASDMCAHYQKIMEQLPFLLNNYLGEHITYQLPSAGLSVGLQFNQSVDLTVVLDRLEGLGYYNPYKIHSVANKQVFSDLRIGIGYPGLKTFEEALKLIRAAVSATGYQKSAIKEVSGSRFQVSGATATS